MKWFIGLAFLTLSCASRVWLIEGCASSDAIDGNHVEVLWTALQDAAPRMGDKTIVLLNHDASRPIGWVRKAWYDNEKLYVLIELAHIEGIVWKQVQLGLINGLSLGFLPTAGVMRYVGNRRIHSIFCLRIVEVSLTPQPSNPDARITRWYRGIVQ